MSRLLTSPGGRWLLLGSLALNLALLMALLLPRFGLGLSGEEPARRDGRSNYLAPWVVRSAFEGERREEINALMQVHREPIRGALREVRRARRELEEALRGDPFDAARFAQALDQLRLREAEAAIAMHGMLNATVAEFDATERAAVAERMFRGGRRSGDGQGRWRRERAERNAAREQPVE